MNKDAGRGSLLIVTLRLDNGQKLPFILDTGASFTLFDKSLEPILGKPLGAMDGELAGVKSTNNYFYTSPKLYLGGAPLIMTGPNIVAWDLRPLSSAGGRPVMGILGMDVLEHYCIQLDFAARKLRFLDGDRADRHNWGKAFPIVEINAQDARPAVSENFLGMQGPHSLIDSGCDTDGWLRPKYFQQWTNGAAAGTNGEFYCPNVMFGGEKYAFVSLLAPDVETASSGSDGIGLRFLARHLVTLDFPSHTLYLKRTSIGPLADEATASAGTFLKDLLKKGRLPGWSKDEQLQPGGVKFYLTADSTTIEFRKKDDPSTYHYTVIRASAKGSWKLQKAWQTDTNDRLIKEYLVPQETHPR